MRQSDGPVCSDITRRKSNMEYQSLNDSELWLYTRYHRLRSLSSCAHQSNSGDMGAKSERVLISESTEATPI